MPCLGVLGGGCGCCDGAAALLLHTHPTRTLCTPRSCGSDGGIHDRARRCSSARRWSPHHWKSSMRSGSLTGFGDGAVRRSRSTTDRPSSSPLSGLLIGGGACATAPLLLLRPLRPLLPAACAGAPGCRDRRWTDGRTGGSSASGGAARGAPPATPPVCVHRTRQGNSPRLFKHCDCMTAVPRARAPVLVVLCAQSVLGRRLWRCERCNPTVIHVTV